MNWISRHEMVRLEPPGALSLDDAAGVEITCSSGRLWITMEGDTRDITLAAGESYTIERNGRTIVSACESSIVVTRLQWDASYAGWRPWLRRFSSWLVRMAEARVRTHARLSRYY